MKKIVMTIVAAGLAVGTYAGVVQFNWTGALEDSTGTEPVALTTTAFTFTSTDLVRDLVIDGNGDVLIGDLDSVGNDTLWGTPSPVDILPVFLGGGFQAGLIDGTGSIATQYGYALIFDGVFADISAVTEGTRFGLVDIDAAYLIEDLGGNPSPNDIQEFAAGTVQMTGTVIPEPATIGLLGIAGLGMFLARRKARR